MKMVNAMPRAVALSSTLVFGALLSFGPAGQAKADNYYNTNGTDICRATSSVGASAFYYNHTYIWNGSASTQYLTCVIPNHRVPTSDASMSTYLYWTAGASGGTVTSTTQMAAYYFGASEIASGNTQSATIAAGGNATLIFPSLARTAHWQSVNIICSVPASFKLGLVINIETS